MFFQQLASSLRETASSIREGVERYTATSREEIEAEERRLRAEERREARRAGRGVAPWAVFDEAHSILEEEARRRVLAVCEDAHLFEEDLLPEPWTAAFEMAAWAPYAARALEGNRALEAMRFRMVPKEMSEDTFWSRFFFQVARVRREVGIGELRAADEAAAEEKALAEEEAAEEAARLAEQREAAEKREAAARAKEAKAAEAAAAAEAEAAAAGDAAAPSTPPPRARPAAAATPLAQDDADGDARLAELERSLGDPGVLPSPIAAAPHGGGGGGGGGDDDDDVFGHDEFASDDPTKVDLNDDSALLSQMNEELGLMPGSPPHDAAAAVADLDDMQSLDDMLSGVDLTGADVSGVDLTTDLEDEINASLNELAG